MIFQHARYGCALVALFVFLCLSGCSPAPAVNTAVPPKVASSPSAAVRAPASAKMGLEIAETMAEEDIQLLRPLSPRWVRVPLRWRDIEPAPADPPRYVFSEYDALLRSLSDAGYTVILTLRDNPPWAADTSCGPLNEDGLTALARFLREVVSRYGTPPYNVHHWELYNEPDNTEAELYGSQGGCWGDAPDAYAAVLQLAWETIKPADPEAVLIFGGVALEQIEGNPFNVRFLEQVLEAGGGPYFDWFNFHYYPAFSFRWNRFGPGIVGKMAYAQDVLRKAGWDKPILCSEVGQPNAGPAQEGYSDQSTVAELVKTYARLASTDMPAGIWHKFRDRPDEVRLYGIVDAAGAPKPAYVAYQQAERLFSNAVFAGDLAENSGSAHMEGYRFEYAGTDGFSTLVIAWTEKDRPAQTLNLPAEHVKVISFFAQDESAIEDADSNDLNPQEGLVGVEIGDMPLAILY